MNESGNSELDLVLEGGTVIDGSGAPGLVTDIGIRGSRIDALGDLHGQPARRRISVRNKTITPGFIDTHTHDDRAVLSSPDMTPKISQGVTTVITGNCGVSLAPLAGQDPPPPLNLLGDRAWYRFATVEDYIAAVEQAAPAVNLAMLVGHSTLRVGAMDDLRRPATATELARMGDQVDCAMHAGFIGMSTGLAYAPAAAAPTAEVVALAERVSSHGGIYTTHMRDERARVVDSVKETIDIGKRAGVAVVISHHKCAGSANWGLSRDTLALIAEARKVQTIDLDVYPYVASSTVLVENWALQTDKVLITWSHSEPSLAGRYLDDICTQWHCTREAAVERLNPAGAIYFQMDEDDLQRIMAFTDTMIGSDGLPHDEFPHPRLWGTFPRVLGHYSRELGLFSLANAVRRMTSVPARVFGLRDRGTIRCGAYADLVVFDADQVIDTASFTCSNTLAHGIEQVFVNGEAVWHDQTWSGKRPGRVLRRVS